MRILLVFLLVALAACGQHDLQREVVLLKGQLAEKEIAISKCSEELADLKNTPEQRFAEANKLLTANRRIEAKKLFEELAEKYPGTNEEKTASKEIAKIEAEIKKEIEEEERKKRLGFKVLKASKNIEVEYLILKIEKVWTGKRWTFDNYGDRYFLRDAERGSTHILVRMSVSSTINEPFLTPIMAYELAENGELKLIGTLHYEFRRWKDYGSYLGNYADYGNDFAHSKTIPFNLGLEIPESKANKPIFIVVRNENNVKRVTKPFGSPKVKYELSNNLSGIGYLQLEDFEEDFSLITILNGSKL